MTPPEALMLSPHQVGAHGAHVIYHPESRGIHDPETQPLETHAPLAVFAVHKEPRIKAPASVKQLASNEKKNAGQPIDLDVVFPIPIAA
jgi:hypothetical protein